MSRRFDDLSRTLAGPTSRRGALKLMGAAAAAATAGVVLRPFQAQASCTAGTTPCGTTCCPGGVACRDFKNSICGCSPGFAACGTTCCQNQGDFCAFIGGKCAACCPAGTTPCGRACCASGSACVNRSTATCGCPAGTIACGTGPGRACCPAGAPCPTDTSTCLAAGALNHCIT
jgi:hypothetical protein